MKITVKTLQQKSHVFDVEPAHTVSQLKQQINSLLQHPVDHQKLIHSGKILANENPLSDYGIKEGDFLVLMVTKAPAKTTTPAVSSTSSTAASKSTAATSKAPTSTTKTAPTSTATASTTPAVSHQVPSTTATETTPAVSDQMLSGTAYEQAVQNLMEMGFERDQIVRAMRAAFNNPDRAVEYLMNGIPASAELPAAPTSAGNNATLPGSGGAMGGSELGQLRELLRTQPELIGPVLQQLGQTNPELMQLIGQNPAAFLQWLEQMGGEDGEGQDFGFEGGDYGDEEGEDAEMSAENIAAEEATTGNQQRPPGSQVIRLTQAEVDAVDRLAALGFEKNQALEAYLACDKNEELAANYLFDSMN